MDHNHAYRVKADHLQALICNQQVVGSNPTAGLLQYQ